MFEVLQPLEVGAGDTAAVDKEVGRADDASLRKNFFGREGRGAIGAFEDCLNLDLLSVHFVERLLNGGRDKIVGLLVHEEGGVSELGFLGAGEAF